MKNNGYPIYFKSKANDIYIYIYMQVMMAYGGFGMEIWNVVSKK